MDYQSAENQVVQLHQQADQVATAVSNLATKLQTAISDAQLARELTLDLKEAALAIQSQNQQTQMLLEQMAQYIHTLESQLGAQPQASFQPRGWAQQSYATSGGGFMGNLVSGLGLGAGFGLANDIVGGIFNAF
jgi:hypothetical protein